MSAVQIPQSTSRVVMLKLFLTGTTTAATGKTLAVVLSKAGAAFGNPNAGATNAAEVSSGWYKVTLDTTDTGTPGDLIVRGTAAGCDDSERLFAVVKATNAGLTGIPDAAANANGGLPILSGGGAALAYTVTLPANPPAGFLAAASVAAGALNGKGDWNTAAPLDAAGTRSAVGLASASLDGQLAALDADVLTRLAAAAYAAPDNATLAHLATALESSAGAYRFTVAALANAPTGGGSDSAGIAAIKAKTDLLGAGVSVVTSPVSGDGNVRVVKGAAYLARDGLALTLAAPLGGWPDLTGAAVELVVRDGPKYAGAVVTPSGVGQSVRAELTAAQTAAAASGPCQWWATLSNGDPFPLSGVCSFAALAAVGP